MTDDKLKQANALRGQIQNIERLLGDCERGSAQTTLDWEAAFPKEMLERHRAELLGWAEANLAELKARFEAL